MPPVSFDLKLAARMQLNQFLEIIANLSFLIAEAHSLDIEKVLFLQIH